MFNTLKKLKTNRLPFSKGPFLLQSRAPLLNINPHKLFASTQTSRETTQVEDTQYKGSFEELISKRSPPVYSAAERAKELEKMILETHKTPKQLKQERLEELRETYGPNFHRIVNTSYQVKVDALKSFEFTRETRFSFQESLDNYKFADNLDYQVLDRNDEVKALSRMSYVELANSFIKKKFKYTVKEDEHFSKFENEYYCEDYLQGKPDNFVAVFNFPKSATSKELYDLFSQYGKIKSYNMKKAFIGSPAAFEVLYENKEGARAAKDERNQSRYNGTTLYVRTNEDAEYEHPHNRTLAIQNLDYTLSFQSIVESLNRHGSVMHFEMPVGQKTNKLPSREELDYYIRHNNISQNGQLKINITHKKYHLDDCQVKCDVTLEENVLESRDKRSYFNDAKAMGQDMKTIKDQYTLGKQQEVDAYKKRIFGDPNERSFEVADTSAFHVVKLNPHTQELFGKKDDPSLQYYLKNIEEIKNGSGAPNLSLNNRIGITNYIERPDNFNLGYCFVTFSNTNEAKRAMASIPMDPSLGKDLEVVLKKEEGHIDFDREYFSETFEKLREETHRELRAAEEAEQNVRDKGQSANAIREFQNNTFKGEFEKGLLDYPIKKDKIEEKKQPEEWIQFFEQQEGARREKTRETLQQVFANEAESNFSRSGNLEINAEDEEDVDYKLGRSYSAQITDKDWNNFEKALNNRRRVTNELKVPIANRKKAAFEELLEKDQKMADGLPAFDSQNLKEFRLDIRQESDKFRTEDFIEDNMVLDMKAANSRRRRMFQELRKKASRARFENIMAKKGDVEKKEGEDMYFDPFKSKKPVEKTTESSNIAEDLAEREKFLQKKEKFVETVRKVYTADYTNEEMENYIEKLQKEAKDAKQLRPHFLQTDRQGNEYVTKEDEAAFEEEALPDDPEERFRARQQIEDLKRLKDSSWWNQIKNQEEDLEPVLATFMMNGFPIDSFRFKPSEEYPTIDDFIQKNKGLDPVYTYEKSYDEDGNEVVIKLAKSGDSVMDPSLDFESIDQINQFAHELQDYLRENGISEEELGFKDSKGTMEELLEARHNMKPTTELREVDQKIIELLMKKYPAHLIEKILTTDPFENFEETVNQFAKYNGLKEAAHKARALTKDDFVKYSSHQLNTKGRDDKYKKSKTDVI